MRARRIVRRGLLIAAGICVVFLSPNTEALFQTDLTLHSAADSKAYLYYNCDPAVVFSDGESRVTIEIATTGQSIVQVRLKSGDSQLSMYDDGTHGDRLAGDGIYTLNNYLVPGGWLLPLGDTCSTWNPGVDIEKTDGTIERANLAIGLVRPGLIIPAVQMAPGLFASEYAFFIVDPPGETLNAVIPLGDIKCGKTAFGAFQKLYSVFPDVFDFVVVTPGGAVFDPSRAYAENVPYFVRAKNAVRNIGVPLFDNTAAFGSQGRLMGMIYHSWGIGAVLDHEIGHAWSASLGKTLGLSHCEQCYGDHWNPLTDLRGQMSAFLFHPDVQFGAGHLFDNGDGTWRIEREDDDTAPYSSLDLYAMGLIPPAEVPPIHKLINPNLTDAKRITAERVETYTIQQVMEAEGGPRIPAFQDSQKEFNLAFVAVKNKEFTPAEFSFYSLMARYFASREPGEMHMNPFYQATGGRGSLNPKLPVSRGQFAQFGNGAGLASSVVLANPSSTDTANGLVQFSDDSGQGMLVSVNGAAAASVAPFSIRPLGTTRLGTSGAGDLGVGSARVVSSIPLGGVVCFSVPGVGIAGVGESAPLHGFVIPVVRSAHRLNTGVALLNLEDYPIEIELTLRGQDGVLVSHGLSTRMLAAREHFAKFVDELFPEASTGDFQGNLRVSVKTSGADVAAAAIQQGSLPGEFTTLPVVPVDPPVTSKELYFAQFGNGQGLASSLFLTNPTGSAVNGQLRFYSDGGSPLFVSVNGRPASQTVAFTVPAYGSNVLTTSGTGALVSGSARVTTDTAIGGVLRFSISGLGIAGVGAAAPLTSIIVPVSHNETTHASTGVAITSLGAATRLTLTLRNENGEVVGGGEEVVDLATNGHIAKYIPELFRTADTRQFTGTITVRSAGGQIAATAIQVGSSPGEFTAFPVTALR